MDHGVMAGCQTLKSAMMAHNGTSRCSPLLWVSVAAGTCCRVKVTQMPVCDAHTFRIVMYGQQT